MKKKAVIWVSTVLYILITIAVLGIAFAALKPKIDEMRDKAIIEQSIEMLNRIDETINQVSEVQGTRRQVQVQLKKGNLIFCYDGENQIVWQFDSSYKYSEPGETIDIGNIKLLTREKQGASGIWKIILTLDYGVLDIQFDNENEKKIITAAELPYIFFIENKENYINIYPSSD